MVKHILIITVGASDQPIVTSIKNNRPDYVYFLCSDDLGEIKGSYVAVEGPGKPCQENKVCITAQTGLDKTKYEIIKVSLDDLSSCYLAACGALKEIRRTNPNAQVIADYTGGTKSMSAGLAAAAMDDGNTDVCIVKGLRINMHQVKAGTQSARIIDSNIIITEKKLQLIDLLWHRFDYQSCLTVLQDIFSRPQSINLSSRLDIINNLCLGFEAWDRFNHNLAIGILQDINKKLGNKLENQVEMLGEIKCVIEWWPDQQKKDPSTLTQKNRKQIYNFMPVFDLILNAQRRNSQGRFDDAVARLYRALEMFGQINLLRWEHPLNSSALKLELLPQGLAENYSFKGNKQAGAITIGLIQNFTLLSELNNPVGIVFNEYKDKIRAALNSRNNSLMAHGIIPVSETECQNIIDIVLSFITAALNNMDIETPDLKKLQYPISLLEDNNLI